MSDTEVRKKFEKTLHRLSPSVAGAMLADENATYYFDAKDLYKLFEAAYAAGSDSRQLTQEQTRAAAEEIRQKFYAKDLDRGYGPNPPRMLLTDAELAEIILKHAGSDSQREAPRPQLGTCREVSFPHEKDKHQWAHNHDPEDGPSGCIGWKAIEAARVQPAQPESRSCPHCVAGIPLGSPNVKTAHFNGEDFVGWCRYLVSDSDYQRLCHNGEPQGKEK